MFESITLSDIGQKSNNDLYLWYWYVFMYSLSQLLVPSFSSQTSIVSIKSNIKSIFPCKSTGKQSWTCCKVDQGQPRISIWINFVGPDSLMLYTKFEGHWPIGFREDGFWRVFTIYGDGSHLGHMTRTVWTNFHSNNPRILYMKFGFNGPSSFAAEDVCKYINLSYLGVLDKGQTMTFTSVFIWIYVLS